MSYWYSKKWTNQINEVIIPLKVSIKQTQEDNDIKEDMTERLKFVNNYYSTSQNKYRSQYQEMCILFKYKTGKSCNLKSGDNE